MSYDKSTLAPEIRVPKNFMNLTDKLPTANYEEPIFFKNKSEAKLKLPKLTSDYHMTSTLQSKIDHLPIINHKDTYSQKSDILAQSEISRNIAKSNVS